jgi:hypothetical protein
MLASLRLAEQRLELRFKTSEQAAIVAQGK